MSRAYNKISQHFLSYFIKRDKILLNWYFIIPSGMCLTSEILSLVDYIGYLSPTIPLLPSLDMNSWMTLNRIQNVAHAIQEILKPFLF